MRKFIVFAAGLAFFAGAPALANEPYLPKSPKGFERADANRDGKIALAEITPLAERRLARLDTDGDRQVSAAELEARFQLAMKRRIERIVQLLDGDKNGSISEAELDKIVADMFNAADTDKDGGLTLAETQGFKRGAWRKSYLTQAQPATGTGTGN